MYHSKVVQSPLMSSLNSMTSLAFYPVGKFILGPYYRRQLFPAQSRGETSTVAGLRNLLLPSKHDPRLHIVEYDPGYAIVPTGKVFIFFHGRNCSASAAAHHSGHSSTDIVRNLLQYGAVFGVNLPGYEKTPLTDGRLKNAEQDTIEIAGYAESFVRNMVKCYGLDLSDIIIVGYSIGMYMSLCLASRLRTASTVLVAPPRDLESVSFSLRGISLAPLIPWAARHAYPAGLEVEDSSMYRTTGFNGIRFIENYCGQVSGNLAIFQAEKDRIVPPDTGKKLVFAFDNAGALTWKFSSERCLARLYTLRGSGHNSSPSRESWEQLWKDWGLRKGLGNKGVL